MALLIGIILVLIFAGALVYLNQKESDNPKKRMEELKENAEALKTYKELLDAGILTESEFEEKKKELLK